MAQQQAVKSAKALLAQIDTADTGKAEANVAFQARRWEDAVDAYLNASGSALPSAGLWTRTGRAIPDVAALATNFQIYSGGSVYGTLTGTSAATPTFAGLVAAVNALRAKDGKATVGFVNPVLYKAGAHLGFDVTDGNNKNPSCPAGFPARAGWDAVSGLGTPTFDKLKELLLED